MAPAGSTGRVESTVRCRESCWRCSRSHCLARARATARRMAAVAARARRRFAGLAARRRGLRDPVVGGAAAVRACRSCAQSGACRMRWTLQCGAHAQISASPMRLLPGNGAPSEQQVALQATTPSMIILQSCLRRDASRDPKSADSSGNSDSDGDGRESDSGQFAPSVATRLSRYACGNRWPEAARSRSTCCKHRGKKCRDDRSACLPASPSCGARPKQDRPSQDGRSEPAAAVANGYFAAASSGSAQAITLSPGLVSMRSWPPTAATMYCLPPTV